MGRNLPRLVLPCPIWTHLFFHQESAQTFHLLSLHTAQIYGLRPTMASLGKTYIL